MEFNISYGKSTTDVISVLIANKLANAWANCKQFVASAFATPVAVRATA